MVVHRRGASRHGPRRSPGAARWGCCSEELLEQARAMAQSAVDRTANAERRATTLCGTVAIAASLTVSGAGLILDRSKVPEQGWRVGFATAFAVATLLFVLSGLYATRALVRSRRWAWVHPDRIPERKGRPLSEQQVDRAAELLHDFAFNWEVSDTKLRALDSSYRAFTAALVVLVVISFAFVAYQSVVVGAIAQLGGVAKESVRHLFSTK